jgi:hypothetical protein
MPSDAPLEDLDYYLRAIWLECCGHLGAFHIGSTMYTQKVPGWSGMGPGREATMNVKIGRLFDKGLEIPYEYDFGSTSHLTIRVVDRREGKALSRRPVMLMARNNSPEIACIHCGAPATMFCVECLYEREGESTICDQHLSEHEDHLDYGEPMPLFNSPRTGMCGYDGPAEPPY